MKTRILILALCCATLVPLLYAAYPNEFPIYLGTLGFSKSEIIHLSGGGLISHSLYDRLPGEYGIVSAIVQNVPAYYFRDYYQYIENYKSLNQFAEVGKFKNIPSLQDLMGLRFSDDELQEFLNCRSGGKCLVQLSTEEVATIPANGNLKTQAGKADVADAYRKILLDRLLTYQTGGTAALAPYVGSPEPQNLMESLNEHLYKFPYLRAYFPRVERM